MMSETPRFDPTKPYTTRDGREVLDLRRDSFWRYPYHGKVDGAFQCWALNGRFWYWGRADHPLDLINVPEPVSSFIVSSSIVPQAEFDAAWAVFKIDLEADRRPGLMRCLEAAARVRGAVARDEDAATWEFYHPGSTWLCSDCDCDCTRSCKRLGDTAHLTPNTDVHRTAGTEDDATWPSFKPCATDYPEGGMTEFVQADVSIVWDRVRDDGIEAGYDMEDRSRLVAVRWPLARCGTTPAEAALEASAPEPGDDDAARIAEIDKAVRYLPRQRMWDKELVFVLDCFARRGVTPAEAPPSTWSRDMDAAPRDRDASEKTREVLLIGKLPSGYCSDIYHSWWCDDHWARWPHNFAPTHWMPLPAPPAAGKGQAVTEAQIRALPLTEPKP